MRGGRGIRTLAILVLGGLSVGCAAGRPASEPVEPPIAAPKEVHGQLFTPRGYGPFPAVVLLHGCAGVHKAVDIAWARQLTSWGYVALVVDSFGPRGVRSACRGFLHVRPPRTADAWAGVDYVRALDYVDPRRIAFMGWSQGAAIALRASAMPAVLDDRRDSLKATIAFYPYCGLQSDFYPPTMVLVGDKDDWTGWTPCESMARRQKQRGRSFDLVLYQNATHSFDCLACNGVYNDHRMIYNPEAHKDALRRVRRFLDLHLR